MLKYLPASLSFVCLLALTLIGFVTTLNNHTETIQKEFDQHANARVSAIQQSIDNKVLLMESIRSLYAVFDGIPQPNFRSIVEPLEDKIHGVQAFQWVVPISSSQREAFEQARRDEGVENFIIRERHPNGKMTRAGSREMYFPVFPVQPLNDTKEYLGFDLASDPPKKAALKEAMRTGNFTVTSGSILSQEGDITRSIVLVFVPLFSGQSFPFTTQKNNEELLGWVMGVFNINNLVDAAIAMVGTELININISDDSVSGVQKLIYRYSYINMNQLSLTNQLTQYIYPTSHTSSINFAGKNWSISSLATSEYMTNRQPTLSLAVLFIGLLSTLVLTSYLIQMTWQTAKIQNTESERKNLEHQLFRSQKMEAIGQLVGGISHDFKNVLTSISGYAELALTRNNSVSEEELNEYLFNISDGAARGENLIEKMLAFGRSTPVDLTSIEVMQVVDNSLSMLSPLLSSSISIEVTHEEQLPDVLIDPTSLEQILVNLCINARDAIEATGEITIDIRTRGLTAKCCSVCEQHISGRYLSLKVSDTGKGIPVENQEVIFKPFFTTKDIGKGSGMGLAIINTIIHNAQGHIILESELGAGTSFELLFPIQSR